MTDSFAANILAGLIFCAVIWAVYYYKIEGHDLPWKKKPPEKPPVKSAVKKKGR